MWNIREEIKGYKIIKNEVLGSGGYGIVFKAQKEGKDYAVKVIKKKDPSIIPKDKSIIHEEEFFQQFKMRNNFPFFVKYFDTFDDEPGNDYFIVMEYCQKGDLSKLILLCKENMLNFDKKMVMKIFIELVLALHRLHTNGFLHRDVKAENVFLDEEDNIKLGDFGTSKKLSEKTTTFTGTEGYISPEQYKEEGHGTASDIWSLGVLLYHLCTLKLPFDCVKETVENAFDPIPEGLYPPDLTGLIHSLLDKDKQNRPSTLDILKNPLIIHYAVTFNLLEHFPRGIIETCVGCDSGVGMTRTGTRVGREAGATTRREAGIGVEAATGTGVGTGVGTETEVEVEARAGARAVIGTKAGTEREEMERNVKLKEETETLNRLIDYLLWSTGEEEKLEKKNREHEEKEQRLVEEIKELTEKRKKDNVKMKKLDEERKELMMKMIRMEEEKKEKDIQCKIITGMEEERKKEQMRILVFEKKEKENKQTITELREEKKDQEKRIKQIEDKSVLQDERIKKFEEENVSQGLEIKRLEAEIVSKRKIIEEQVEKNSMLNIEKNEQVK